MEEPSNQRDGFGYEGSNSLSKSREERKEAEAKYGSEVAYLLSGQPDDAKTMKEFLEAEGINGKKIKADNFNGKFKR